MKSTNIFSLSIFIILVIAACSTGQTAFKKGDYYDATIQAVKNLRVKPTSEKSIALIKKSYPMALDYYRQRIDMELASNNQDKYLNVVEIYTRLNTLADEISRCPAALEVVKPVSYYTEQLKKAEQLAVTEQYNNAQTLLKTELLYDARMALKRLEWVKSKNPSFPNLNNAIILAENLATLKIVVEDYPAISKGFQVNSKVFYYRLFDELVKQNEQKYQRFYKPETAEKLSLKPHEVISVQFVDFTIGTLIEREKTETYKSDSLKVGKYKDSNGVEHDVFGVVQAEINLHEKEILTRGVLKITIKDFRTGEITSTQQFPGEYFWQNQWATYNGDERAVPASLKRAVKDKQRMPPPPQELFLFLSEPLLNTALAHLNNYYKKK